jgi:hypothetical protein
MKTSTRRTTRSITVLLVPKVAKELAETRKRARLSDTDIVNRAITLYDFIDGELTCGAELLLRRPGSPEKEVRLLAPAAAALTDGPRRGVGRWHALRRIFLVSPAFMPLRPAGKGRHPGGPEEGQAP